MCTLACAESCGATIGNSAVAARLFGPLVAGALSLSFTLPPWKALHALPELWQSPYDPNLMMGETISLALSIVSIIYGVLVVPIGYVLMFKLDFSPKVLVALIGLVDIGLGCSMIVELTFKSHYLPRPLGSCKNAAISPFEHLPSIYSVIGRHRNIAPDKACRDFVMARNFQIFLAVIYSCVGISLFFYGVYKYHSKLFYVTRNMLPPFRFAAAYIRKTGLRRYTLEEEKSLQHHHGILLKHLNPLRASKSQNIYEKVFGASSEWTGRWILADYVHYSDIINLSLVSRYVHIKIQSSGGSSREAFRMRTCIPGSKASCWGCGNQICSGCKITRTILDPPSTLHITQCDTVCSGCYFFYACRSSTRFPKTNGGICSHRSRLRRGPVARDLCYSCNTEHLKSGDVAARERKEMTELKHIESAKVFCSLCHVRLWRFTPRWWVCSICGVECRSRLHTHWV